MGETLGVYNVTDLTRQCYGSVQPSRVTLWLGKHGWLLFGYSRVDCKLLGGHLRRLQVERAATGCANTLMLLHFSPVLQTPQVAESDPPEEIRPKTVVEKMSGRV